MKLKTLQDLTKEELIKEVENRDRLIKILVRGQDENT